MRRLFVSLATSAFFVLLAAPAALAEYNDGRGWYGATGDKSITNYAFATLAFFVILVTVASLVQGRLEKRKYARMAAEKARRAGGAWRGHW